MIAVIYHDSFGRHLEGIQHVERPERYFAILDKIKRDLPEDKFELIEAQPAAITDIARVHRREYVNEMASLEIIGSAMLDAGDTYATEYTSEAALHSAGAAIQAASLVISGKFAFAISLGRPPGHHAEPDRPLGFCIFNNAAVAAAALIDNHGLKRVAIIDWDVHHGNGTENMFLEDNRVLYISLHQYPHYPGTGPAAMIGRGNGEGFTLNLPMPSGCGDNEYRRAFNDSILPALDRFKPEFILISAGFDAHRDDPLSGINLSTAMYAEMTSMLKGCADRYCGGRMAAVLEGGYDLTSLCDSVIAHLKVITDIV